MKMTLNVNGRRRSVTIDDPGEPLLYVLRNQLDLKGTKFGCGLGQCGACKVLVDGEALPSCLLPASGLAGQQIITIEGLARGNAPHPVQAAFISEQAAQCGYCTSGMIMASIGLLRRAPKPTTQQVREALDGNLCRCGTHPRIVNAVQRAAGIKP